MNLDVYVQIKKTHNECPECAGDLKSYETVKLPRNNVTFNDTLCVKCNAPVIILEKKGLDAEVVETFEDKGTLVVASDIELLMDEAFADGYS